MSELHIPQHPSPLLTAKAEKFDLVADLPRLKAMLPALRDLMRRKNLVGLALPQVGWSVRGFLYDPFQQECRVFLNTCWNPLRSKFQPQLEEQEGCLSVGDCKDRRSVPRYHTIHAQATELVGWWTPNPKFKPFDTELFGWEARVFQHESDHLQGILLGGVEKKETSHG